jgi:hypothetical protein
MNAAKQASQAPCPHTHSNSLLTHTPPSLALDPDTSRQAHLGCTREAPEHNGPLTTLLQLDSECGQ